MVQRIKTSGQTSINLDRIQNKLHLSSKAAILRLCLSLSLNEKEEVDLTKVSSTEGGFDISLNTLFGEYDVLFRILIKNNYKKSMNEQTFVKLVQAHLERGMIKLYGEFATNNDIYKFIESIVG